MDVPWFSLAKREVYERDLREKNRLKQLRQQQKDLQKTAAAANGSKLKAKT